MLGCARLQVYQRNPLQLNRLGKNEKDDIWVIKTGDSSTTHIEDFVPFEFLVILPQVERFEWAL